MPPDRTTNAFAFFCAVLSPFTAGEEVLQLRQSADRGEVDWVAVAKHANRAGLSPALHWALASKGLSALVPDTFRAYLDEIHCFNLTRNKALLEQQLEVVQLLNGIGVTPLLLKGGAALATELFPDPGIRFMWDLDLLVPEERLEDSVATLLAKGYSVPDIYTDSLPGGANQADHHHFPGLFFPGAPASVELHRRVLRKELGLLEPDKLWEQSRPYEGSLLPGGSVALMSPTDEVIYCFAHSELAHDHHHYERVDARHLQHFAYLCYRYQEQIDWRRIELLKHHPDVGTIFSAYLYLAKKLFRLNLPLSENLPPEAERHYHQVTLSRSVWNERGHMLHLLFLELSRVFAKERLQKLYQQENAPIFRLRLRHLRFLLGRYCHLEPWRVRLRGLAPF